MQCFKLIWNVSETFMWQNIALGDLTCRACRVCSSRWARAIARPTFGWSPGHLAAGSPRTRSACSGSARQSTSSNGSRHRHRRPRRLQMAARNCGCHLLSPVSRFLWRPRPCRLAPSHSKDQRPPGSYPPPEHRQAVSDQSHRYRCCS